MPLKVIFMGTPDFSVPALENLIANPLFEVIAVYSQPPRPAGRGQQLRLSPVHEVAKAHAIPVYTPKSLKKDERAREEFINLHADVAVVAAYGLILPKAVLDAPRFGCLNIHASILPRWRGAAPIQRSIEAGDASSGVTIMQMEEGLDTGPMIRKTEVRIHDTTTGQSLHDELSALGSALIEDVLEAITRSQSLNPQIQDDTLATYASMLKKDEGHIDWALEAAAIDRKVRAFTPWPGCWSLGPSGKRFKVLEGAPSPDTHSSPVGTLLDGNGLIACGNGSTYRIHRIQPESGKPMGMRDALNGGQLATRETLS